MIIINNHNIYIFAQSVAKFSGQTSITFLYVIQINSTDD